jgi:hypothetical protein
MNQCNPYKAPTGSKEKTFRPNLNIQWSILENLIVKLGWDEAEVSER